MNLVELIREPVRQVPDRTALVVGDREMTYGEVGEAVERCAAHLCQRGVGPGDSVALLDDCSPLLIAVILGAARIGAAAVPIHVELQRAELAEVMRLSGCGSLGIGFVRDMDRSFVLSARIRAVRFGGIQVSSVGCFETACLSAGNRPSELCFLAIRGWLGSNRRIPAGIGCGHRIPIRLRIHGRLEGLFRPRPCGEGPRPHRLPINRRHSGLLSCGRSDRPI